MSFYQQYMQFFRKGTQEICYKQTRINWAKYYTYNKYITQHQWEKQRQQIHSSPPNINKKLQHLLTEAWDKTPVVSQTCDKSSCSTSNRPLTERERTERNQRVINILITTALILTCVIAIYARRPSIREQKDELAKEETMKIFLPFNVTSQHIHEAQSQGVGTIGSTKLLLEKLKKCSEPLQETDMLNLLKNVSIEFQACLNILNKLYKINKKRNILQENEDGPKDTTDEEAQYIKQNELLEQQQNSLFQKPSTNTFSPLEEYKNVFGKYLEQICQECKTNPNEDTYQKLHDFLIEAVNILYQRTYPNEDVFKAMLKAYQMVSEHTMDGSTIRSFVESRGDWKYLQDIHILLPLLLEMEDFVKINPVLVDKNIQESPDYYDAIILSYRVRLENKYLFPISDILSQLRKLKHNKIACESLDLKNIKKLLRTLLRLQCIDLSACFRILALQIAKNPHYKNSVMYLPRCSDYISPTKKVHIPRVSIPCKELFLNVPMAYYIRYKSFDTSHNSASVT